MRLIQIVPGIRPQLDGIGDYALQLARRLRDDHGIMTSFLIGNCEWKGNEVDGFPANGLTQQTSKSLVESVGSIEAASGDLDVQILAQFGVYGYAKRGCPYWFVEGWEALQKSRPHRMHVAFHELENSNRKPWSSVFWVSRIQRQLIERVARASDFRYTNTEDHRSRLENWGVGRIALIPNFSTLGEPAENPPFERRANDMVIFGRPTQRQWTYEKGAHVLGPLCRRLKIDRILDIGSPISGGVPSDVGGTPVIQCGRRSEAEVNAAMATSVASFMYYPIPVILKSSVFATSAAFGTVPFVYDNQSKPRSCPGLVTGEDFVALDDNHSQMVIPPLEWLSQRVYQNYALRSSGTAAAIIANRLKKDGLLR